MKARPVALLIGSAILAVMLGVSLLGPWISPYSATEQHIVKRLQRPSAAYLLGTDQYGRDLLSRTIIGGRTALLLGIGAVLLGLVVGVPLGLASGYFGGRVDNAIMRVVDAMLSFPSLLLALLIITVLGASTTHALVAIGIANVPGLARIVRGNTLTLRETDFVLAARARGEGPLYIMFGEIFPNVLPAIIIETTIRIGFAMLAAASLSFLGLGVQPPAADWGLMIREARQYVFLSPWPLVAPGLALGVTIVGFNLFGDGLRDRLGSGS